MDDSFYKAFFTPDVKICGYRLKPFCLGHTLILQAINSPILKPNGEITAADMIVALKVCSSSYPFQPDLKASLVDIWRKSRLKRSRVRLLGAATAFDTYVGAHTSKPKFWTREDAGTGMDITSPGILSLAVSLIPIGTQEEIWSMSIGKAIWYDAVMQERKGARIRFLYESDLEDDLPDLEEATDEELYELALENLGKAGADAWMKSRKSNRNTKSC